MGNYRLLSRLILGELAYSMQKIFSNVHTIQREAAHGLKHVKFL